MSTSSSTDPTRPEDPVAADIQAAQDRIGRAVDRAQGGERQLAGYVREYGEQLARLLGGSCRMTHIHDLHNHAFDMPMNELEQVLRRLLDLLGAVHLILVEDQIYVNDIRVRFDAQSQTPVMLAEAFQPHHVGGLSLHGPIDSNGFRTLVQHLVTPPPTGEGGRKALQNRLFELGLRMVELQPPFRLRITGEKADRPRQAQVTQIHARASKALAGVWDNMAAGRSPNPLPVRRMVSDLLELSSQQQDKELVEGARDRQTPPHVRHAMEVVALSLMIGRELGLSEALLSDLGVAACYHDAGYATEEDGYPPPFERHTTAGARLLLTQRGFHEARVRRLLVTLEHHQPFNASPHPTLLARIIKIADDYDTFTRHRGNGTLLSPPQAITRMNGSTGTLYDPELMQCFVNRVGPYPPGSLLELDDQSWVMSVSGVRSPEHFSRPLTLVVRLPDGCAPAHSQLIDLSESPRRILRDVGSS